MDFFKETSFPVAATTPEGLVASLLDTTGHSHLFLPLPFEPKVVPIDRQDLVSAYPMRAPAGETSLDEGHRHPVLAVIGLEPVVEMLPSATQQGQMEPTPVAFREVLMRFEIGEAEGHVHLPGGEIPRDANRDRAGKSSERDEETFKNVYELRKAAIDCSSVAYARARKADDFVMGEQWGHSSEVQPVSVDESTTPELTMNHVQSIVNTISGIERNSRTDPAYFPVEGGDDRAAAVLDVVVKDMLTYNDFYLERSLAFEDAIGPGIGVLHVTSELSPELTEDLVVCRVDWRNVHLGPHSHVNLRDLLHAHIDEWMTKRELELLYPDRVDEIDRFFESGTFADTGGDGTDTKGEVYIPNTKVPVSQLKEMAGRPAVTGKPKSPDLAVVDFTARTIKHVTSYILERRSVPVVVTHAGEPVNLDGVGPKNLRRIRTVPGIALVDVPQKRVRRINWAGDLILRDDISELTGDYLPIVVYYGKKFRDKFAGKVEPIMDMQRNYNKLASLLIDALLRAARGNRVYDKETFGGNERLRDEFAANMSKSNMLLEVENQDRPPALLENDKFPFDLAQGKNDLLNEMRVVSNVNPEMLGMTAFSRETGAASADRIQQALLGNEYLFENKKFADRRLYKMLVYSIRHIYRDNPDALLRILGTHVLREEVRLQGQKYGPEAPIPPDVLAGLRDVLEKTDLLKHDVVPEESSSSPTVRMRLLGLITNLTSTGAIPFVPEFIDLMPLPPDMKEKIKQALQSSQAQKAEMDTLPYRTEIVKTQIKNQQEGGQGPVTA